MVHECIKEKEGRKMARQKDYIIPARFFNGAAGKLRESDLGAWRSLVAQHADTVEVEGSNPSVPTKCDIGRSGKCT